MLAYSVLSNKHEAHYLDLTNLSVLHSEYDHHIHLYGNTLFALFACVCIQNPKHIVLKHMMFLFIVSKASSN